jgi:hypothetical protein
MKITKWNLPEKVQIRLLNLGIHEEPQLVKLNVDLDSSIIDIGEELFKEYKDIFTWTYKDLKGIPPHLV